MSAVLVHWNPLNRSTLVSSTKWSGGQAHLEAFGPDRLFNCNNTIQENFD
jgi:hypothetical protein